MVELLNKGIYKLMFISSALEATTVFRLNYNWSIIARYAKKKNLQGGYEQKYKMISKFINNQIWKRKAVVLRNPKISFEIKLKKKILEYLKD